MSNEDVYTTIRRARTLQERHPDVHPSVAHVALVMATYADGATGRNIRPGFDRLARETGLHPKTVKRAIRWLEEHNELWRVKQGNRGSAACFTYRLYDVGKGVPDAPKGGASEGPHQPTHSGSPNPRGPHEPCVECGKRRALNDSLVCRQCWGRVMPGAPWTGEDES